MSVTAVIPQLLVSADFLNNTDNAVTTLHEANCNVLYSVVLDSLLHTYAVELAYIQLRLAPALPECEY
jgi:hypothetical protein